MTDQNDRAHALIDDDPSTTLSSNRTSLSLERTKMSADRTLMSIMRTSLSLISFGFTIFEAFIQAQRAQVLEGSIVGARNLGLSLVILGIILLGLGIASHMRLATQLNRRRAMLYADHLLTRDLRYQATPTFVVAFLLLAIGVATAGWLAIRQLT